MLEKWLTKFKEKLQTNYHIFTCKMHQVQQMQPIKNLLEQNFKNITGRTRSTFPINLKIVIKTRLF